MFCYKIVVAFDGTDYHGWQFQPNAMTVSQALTDSFRSVFGCDISLFAASRTDAGVHALGQVAIVRSPIQVPVDKLKHAWNNALPKDILIKAVFSLEKLIHPHAGVRQKTYWYHFFTEQPLPFFQRYGWNVDRSVDIELLKKALSVFVGTHDFRSFCTGNEMNSTVRTVDSISVEFVKEVNAYRIVIKGKGFLRYMVRRIVGACLDVACFKKATIDDLTKALLAVDPSNTLLNAPAKGLVLQQIVYDSKGVGNELLEK